jgi:hypothetical protein
MTKAIIWDPCVDWLTNRNLCVRFSQRQGHDYKMLWPQTAAINTDSATNVAPVTNHKRAFNSFPRFRLACVTNCPLVLSLYKTYTSSYK